MMAACIESFDCH